MSRILAIVFCCLFVATFVMQAWAVAEPEPEPQRYGGHGGRGGGYGGGNYGGGRGGRGGRGGYYGR